MLISAFADFSFKDRNEKLESAIFQLSTVQAFQQRKKGRNASTMPSNFYWIEKGDEYDGLTKKTD